MDLHVRNPSLNYRHGAAILVFNGLLGSFYTYGSAEFKLPLVYHIRVRLSNFFIALILMHRICKKLVSCKWALSRTLLKQYWLNSNKEDFSSFESKPCLFEIEWPCHILVQRLVQSRVVHTSIPRFVVYFCDFRKDLFLICTLIKRTS
jgi:hypothetical protein